MTDKMIERIQNLLAIASHPNTPVAEAETAQKQAEKLMVRHGIDSAILASKSGQKEKYSTVHVDIKSTYAKQLVHGLGAAAQSFKTVFVTISLGSNASSGRIYLTGATTDILPMQDMITSLVEQAQHACKAWWKTQPADWVRVLTPMERFKERREFILHFGIGVGNRIVAERREVEAQSAGTDLVLVNRQALAKEHFEKENGHGSLRESRYNAKRGSSSASADGQAAGYDATISRGSVASGAGVGAIGR